MVNRRELPTRVSDGVRAIARNRSNYLDPSDGTFINNWILAADTAPVAPSAPRADHRDRLDRPPDLPCVVARGAGLPPTLSQHPRVARAVRRQRAGFTGRNVDRERAGRFDAAHPDKSSLRLRRRSQSPAAKTTGRWACRGHTPTSLS
jgi:hypothetical protein